MGDFLLRAGFEAGWGEERGRTGVEDNLALLRRDRGQYAVVDLWVNILHVMKYIIVMIY